MTLQSTASPLENTVRHDTVSMVHRLDAWPQGETTQSLLSLKRQIATIITFLKDDLHSRVLRLLAAHPYVFGDQIGTEFPQMMKKRNLHVFSELGRLKAFLLHSKKRGGSAGGAVYRLAPAFKRYFADLSLVDDGSKEDAIDFPLVLEKFEGLRHSTFERIDRYLKTGIWTAGEEQRGALVDLVQTTECAKCESYEPWYIPQATLKWREKIQKSMNDKAAEMTATNNQGAPRQTYCSEQTIEVSRLHMALERYVMYLESKDQSGEAARKKYKRAVKLLQHPKNEHWMEEWLIMYDRIMAALQANVSEQEETLAEFGLTTETFSLWTEHHATVVENRTKEVRSQEDKSAMQLFFEGFKNPDPQNWPALDDKGMEMRRRYSLEWHDALTAGLAQRRLLEQQRDAEARAQAHLAAMTNGASVNGDSTSPDPA